MTKFRDLMGFSMYLVVNAAGTVESYHEVVEDANDWAIDHLESHPNDILVIYQAKSIFDASVNVEESVVND
jgi:hypothetical protein